MGKFTKYLIVGLVLLISQLAINAQTTGSISGTVVDTQGAVVPGATVTVKGEAGQRYTATTNDNGVYNIPAVGAGTSMYTVSVSAPNFKTAVVQNVKVDVGTPATVNATLTAGKIEETVVVTSGSDVLQSSTATVGTTITGRQITETPIQSRDALDLVTLLPGTATGGVVRTSSVNGLPKSALAITIDGVDVNDNYLKSSDGFFTFVRPRIDAIDEVTVSTATPGAESSGDGAVAIKFVTRRGTNDYTGSLFWQHRDEGLNANNWFNNATNSQKTKLRLNQFGGRVGGPIPFLGFGEGTRHITSGKDKRFFFVDYERFHLNESSPLRTRQVATQEAQNGIFRYGTNGQFTANLFNLPTQPTDCNPNVAGNQACPNTVDPTVNALLNTIRATTAGTGTFTPVSGIYYRQNFNFSNPGQARRRFLAIRGDINITKDHSLSEVYNSQPFRSNVDFLNSVDPAFPGLNNAGTQQSDRYSNSIALRSNFGQNIVNEFRFANLWGSSNFDLVGGTDFFNNQGGNTFAFGGGLTNATIRNAYSKRSSPTKDFTDTLTMVSGNHTWTFGGQYKRIETISDSVSRIVPTVTFGLATGDPALALFSSANSATNFPGATATDLTNAQGLWATLVGRISGLTSQAVLEGNGKYAQNGNRHFHLRENTYGLFAQDNWRIKPNFSVTLGVRWQPQTGAQTITTNYARLTDFNMVYDVSGTGNLFSPGTLTGVVPTVTGVTAGEKAFKDDKNNFAPSVGFVWSPGFEKGFLGKVFGRGDSSVFRGGFSRSFIREGTLVIENTIGQNPGGSFATSKTAALGNLLIGTNLRDPGNTNLQPAAFNPDPVYPRALTTADSAFGISPDLHSGYVDSWSFGYQRQLGKDTVVELRYVGNRGKEMINVYQINEVNAIENGFGAEFALAQQNLIANLNAGRGSTFAYFGAGTGTSPLPILVSYLQAGNPNAGLTTSYGTNFSTSTYLNFLSPANPNPLGLAANLTNTAATRGNGAAAGRPSNFFQNCPTTLGFCFLADNSERSWFDAGTVEIRRRLSNGLRFQGSYTYGKAFTNTFASANTTFFGLGAGDQSNASNNSLRNRSLDKSFAQIDLRHAFKFDATLDLPFGKGRRFVSGGGISNTILGGWSISPTLRWQSGSPNLMENIQLVGMTAEELQKAVKVRKTPGTVYYLPQDIIDNTIKAFTTVSNTTTGYAAGTAPSGRFIAPAGYGNCQQRSLGTCGFRKFVLYGPSFFKMDASILKRISLGERRNVELRATVFDVLNHTNWRIGNWTGNVQNITVFTGTFGQLGNGTTYQDPNGSNDPGGRLLDLSIRFNW